jgi:hypothetical protein
MSIMLPTAREYAGSLTEVLPSLLSSIGVEEFPNALEVTPGSSAVLVVVDGLGQHNLEQARGHARFMLDDTHLHKTLTSVFPTTTASALTSLMTGDKPGVHGIVGYRVREPDSGRLINQLSELHTAPPNWIRSTTLAQRARDSAEVYVVGRAKFSDSALTQAIYRGATYVSRESVEERCSSARELASVPGRIVIVYVSELDTTAHKFGVQSTRWADELEGVDGELRRLRNLLSADVGIFVTADHGVMDVDRSQHIVVADESLLRGVSDIGGEPRCLQLFVTADVKVDDMVRQWRSAYGHIADIVSRADFLSTGLFGTTDEDVSRRLGDILVCAREDVVFYDGRDANTAPQKMIGQHGAVSEIEVAIPFIELTLAG